MTSTPAPGGQADDLPEALDIPQLRARAELHLIDRCGLPHHLLPSGLEGVLRVMAEEVRTLAQRRLRLCSRLHIAAVSLVGQAVRLIDETGLGLAPADGTEGPVNMRDVAAVEGVTARVLELDHQLTRWVAALVKAAEAAGVQAPAEPWADQKSPPGR